ncbi:hypothetical protein ACJRO7_018748 [Eucalyptus globulus]|uniref:Ripening-related protein 1 n=1 Tax=Eucalyptus globulus TaxID=34317 RepID=A0ABD3KUT7_EUCGL
MKKQVRSNIFILITLFLGSNHLGVEAQPCKPSGWLRGREPPPKKCNPENDSECCIEGRPCTTYKCSTPVSHRTKAKLTLNSFEKGGDGGGPSECDKNYHSDNTPLVALSTGWLNRRHRCFENITIYANRRSVMAMVVDECDSAKGCDPAHDYQPPCPNNVVDASEAVQKALGVPRHDWGELDIYWSDERVPLQEPLALLGFFTSMVCQKMIVCVGYISISFSCLGFTLTYYG